MKKLLVLLLVIFVGFSIQPVFAAEVTSDVTLVEPDVWETIKQNIALVVSGLATLGVSIKLLLSTLSSSIKGVGDLLSKKKEDGDNAALSFKEKTEAAKNALVRKGQLEAKIQTTEAEILSLDLKLDFVDNPESKVKIESRIAELKAQLASAKTELEIIDSKFSTITNVVNKL
jgi:hypothetical protein